MPTANAQVLDDLRGLAWMHNADVLVYYLFYRYRVYVFVISWAGACSPFLCIEGKMEPYEHHRPIDIKAG